jgi:hypothetical protein
MGIRGRDLTGEQVGKLAVVRELDESSCSPSGRKAKLWLCRCECGREVKVPRYRLMTAHVKTCGSPECRSEAPRDPDNPIFKARIALGLSVEAFARAVETAPAHILNSEKKLPSYFTKDFLDRFNRVVLPQHRIYQMYQETPKGHVRLKMRVCQNQECNQIFAATTSNIGQGWGKFCSTKCSVAVQMRKRYEGHTKYFLCTCGCGRSVSRKLNELKARPRVFFSTECYHRASREFGRANFPANHEISETQVQQLDALRPYPSAPLPARDVLSVIAPAAAKHLEKRTASESEYITELIKTARKTK